MDQKSQGAGQKTSKYCILQTCERIVIGNAKLCARHNRPYEIIQRRTFPRKGPSSSAAKSKAKKKKPGDADEESELLSLVLCPVHWLGVRLVSIGSKLAAMLGSILGSKLGAMFGSMLASLSVSMSVPMWFACLLTCGLHVGFRAG